MAFSHSADSGSGAAALSTPITWTNLMPSRPLWPLLAYGALALAVSLRGSPPQGQAATAAPGSRKRGARPREDAAHEEREPVPASEHGRGRHADTPWQIPWAGWKDILLRAYQDINRNRLLAVAAGVVFYGLLALFPAITALVSLYGLFSDPSAINAHLSAASGILPSGAVDVVRQQLTRVAESKGSGLTLASVFGILVALWSANSGMKAVIDALNVANGETEKRGFVRLTLVSLAFTLGAIASIMLAIGAVVVVPVVLNHLGLGPVTHALVRIARWPLLAALVVVGLAVLYRYAPSRREPRWQWLSVGSVAAAVLWLAGSALFSWYVSSFGSYNATYGSLGAVIGLMVWMWLSAIVILAGAELNSEIEHQTLRDSTAGGDKPLGARGAVSADTVGAAEG